VEWLVWRGHSFDKLRAGFVRVFPSLLFPLVSELYSPDRSRSKKHRSIF
jgi:hypothetical protein